MTIGEKITKLRKENNLTQEQFAEVMHVSRQSVSKWELNITYPDTKKLIRMSKLFNCSLDYLFKEEIENSSENVQWELNEERELAKKASLLVYLSFPPLFGFIVGILSVRFQLKNKRNKLQLFLTALGMLFSLCLTVAMFCGAIFGL